MPQSHNDDSYPVSKQTATGNAGGGKFLDQVANACRVGRPAYRTEQSYLAWIRRFILFHGKRHPREMGASEVRAFLTHLAVNRQVAASTQNQALNAIVFMYREVLKRDPGEFGGFQRARRSRRLGIDVGRRDRRSTPWRSVCRPR